MTTRPPRHTLPPYIRRPQEGAAAKIARLLAELAAAAAERRAPWWREGGME